VVVELRTCTERDWWSYGKVCSSYMTLNVPSASAHRLRSPEGIFERKRVTLPPSTRLTNSMQSIWKRADLNGPRVRVRVRVEAYLPWL
jgi:hypothetical protein